MKPSLLSISQLAARHDARSAPRGASAFPRTDYHFHAPADDVAVLREQQAAAKRAELQSFRRLSSDYLDEKSHQGYLVDMLAYALVAGLAAWALGSLVVTLALTGGW